MTPTAAQLTFDLSAQGWELSSGSPSSSDCAPYKKASLISAPQSIGPMSRSFAVSDHPGQQGITP